MDMRKVRRSRLVMPINRENFVSKAWLRNADAIVLDLEDSVPYTEKVGSRKLISSSIPLVKKGGSDLFVRINSDQELIMGDLEASILPGVDGIVLPKVESAKTVELVAAKMSAYEASMGIKIGTIRISILLETALGILNIQEILQSSERIDSVSLGAEDFLLDVGMKNNEVTNTALLNLRLQIIMYARANNIMPLGLLDTISDYQNLSAIREKSDNAYAFGFVGSSCIHPAQVEIFNQAFQPSLTHIKESQNLIVCFEKSLKEGRASALYNGKMIDLVHYHEAQKLVAYAKEIAIFEEKKAKARSLNIEQGDIL